MRILFDSKLPRFKTPFGVLNPGQLCILHIDIPCSCRTVHAELLLLKECGEIVCTYALEKEKTEDLYETFGVSFAIDEPGLYFYYFRITTPNETFRLFKQGNDTNMEAGDWWQISCVDTTHLVPQAMQGAVMYQIFPDRFCRAGVCDCTDKLQPYWVHGNVKDVPVYLPDVDGEIKNNDFYGGNLRGIREKLPYLRDLGVDILYLNPIFMAWSTHRYDTYDYKRIDPMLGTEEDFTELCDAAHALGLKIVLDGVFSHVGSRSKYFQSAIRDYDSPYRKWFDFQHWPAVYTSWWGITTLPCVNELEPEFLRYIIDDEDSVCAKWLRLGADGFRLDVADELPDAFILRLRNRIRALKPDAILVGEVWEDASNKIAYDTRRRYFIDRELDSVMNYPWRTAILRYVRGEDDGSALFDSVMTIAENYPSDVLQALMNILSTHDTPRVRNELLDPSNAEREELAKRHLSSEALAHGLKMQRMAAFLQFMLPGMPCIYYGDEAGMIGWRDPFNRGFYPWGEEDEDLQAFYRSLARVKKSHPAIKNGTVRMEYGGQGRIGFVREYEGKRVRVCCNRSHESWTLECSGKVLFESETFADGQILTLQPGGFAVMEA
ncbi:MAG: glycoside hydrolase family 13 protein [Oscillospiraceae bacterium]|nr:glycoside hydrolase family 13 protein [Oscillospiraceae bacterium]